MLELVVGGAIAGIGAFIFGYLILAIFRWISPDGFLTKLLEDELNTQAWEKRTEPPRVTDSGAPGGSSESRAASADLLSDSDLSSDGPKRTLAESSARASPSHRTPA